MRLVRILGSVVLAIFASAPDAGACTLAFSNNTASLNFGAPSDRPISTNFGMKIHRIFGILRLHPGIDYAGPIGDPIRAAATGRVIFAGYRGEYGNRMEIDHGGGCVTTYSHLARFVSQLKVGDCVEAGGGVGYVGATGLAAGPHLHFEVVLDGISIDPAGFYAR